MSQAQPQQQPQQQSNVNVLPPKGSPEYIQHMAAKWDASQARRNPQAPQHQPAAQAQPAVQAQPQAKPAPQQAQPAAQPKAKPEGVPDKFWNAKTGEVDVVGLAKSYTALEKTRAQPQAQPKQPAAQPQAKPQGQQPTETDAQAAVQNAGLDWGSLSNKIATAGNLEDADYTALEKAGIPKEIASSYVDSIKELASVARERTALYAGGEEKLDRMLTSAAQGLSAEERTFLNKQLASKDWKRAIDTLKQRFGDETDAEGNLVVTETNAGGSSGAFSNQQEMVAAMRDPRYKNDPTYRDTVRARVAVSKF